MNIFVLDTNPRIAAEYHVDSHVLKMVVELAQLLSTAHRVLDGKQYLEVSSKNRNIKRWSLSDSRDSILYKATHVNHPCAVWVRESVDNYMWAYNMFLALCDEFTFRYGKKHKSSALASSLNEVPKNIPSTRLTPFAQAMPDYCKDKDAVTAYRSYYILEKQKLHKYSKRSRPYWL